MKLIAGVTYFVHNVDVPQGLPRTPPQFRLTDIYDYNGAYVAIGYKLTHQQHVYIHGFETIPEHQGGFVVCPGVGEVLIDNFSLGLLGSRLRLEHILTGDIIPMMNWGRRVEGLWITPGGQRTSKDNLVLRARLAIDGFRIYRQQTEYKSPRSILRKLQALA